MIVRLDKEQQASSRRQLLTDVVWAICNDTLRQLLHDKKTTLTPVEVFLSAQNFSDTLLKLEDIDEGIEYEMDDLETEADGTDDAVLVMMLASAQLQAISRRRVGTDIPKIILHLYERCEDHDLFLPLLQGFSHKEEARWLEGKRTDLMNYELHEIEQNGGGLKEITSFVEQQVNIAMKLTDTEIKSYLLILEKINIDNHHAFDKQLLKLYDKLGIPRVNINNFNQGSKAMVFNGEVNDSTIIN